MEEKEIKFLNIDTNLIEKKLEEIGAKKLFERLYKRRVFDYPDLRLNKEGSWIRVRDEDDKIMLGFKKRIGMGGGKDGNDKGMEEIEVEVSDFNKTCDILLRSGLIEKHYVENRRIRYQLDDIEYDIDIWPELEPYLEIEAPSWDSVHKGIALLGLNLDEGKIFSTYQIYKLKGIDFNDYQLLTFDKVIKK